MMFWHGRLPESRKRGTDLVTYNASENPLVQSTVWGKRKEKKRKEKKKGHRGPSP